MIAIKAILEFMKQLSPEVCSFAGGGQWTQDHAEKLQRQEQTILGCNLHCMSNSNSRNKRGTGYGRVLQSQGREKVRGLSNPSLKGRVSGPISQTAGHAKQSGDTITASSSDAQTTRQRMNVMASVSRSSGLQKDGDE